MFGFCPLAAPSGHGIGELFTKGTWGIMDKFLWMVGGGWVVLSFLFVFALAAAARKRPVIRQKVFEVKPSRANPPTVSPSQLQPVHSAYVAESAQP